ncbi:MAG TPA: hypothetical protein PLB14_00895, partial [Smithellaceae bacterium]|nr:hypothetical protein [Smithellaceae bacterium]
KIITGHETPGVVSWALGQIITLLVACNPSKIEPYCVIWVQHVLDAGFHQHDDVDGFFTIATQSPWRSMHSGKAVQTFALKLFKGTKTHAAGSDNR